MRRVVARYHANYTFFIRRAAYLLIRPLCTFRLRTSYKRIYNYIDLALHEVVTTNEKGLTNIEQSQLKFDLARKRCRRRFNNQRQYDPLMEP